MIKLEEYHSVLNVIYELLIQNGARVSPILDVSILGGEGVGENAATPAGPGSLASRERRR
jgi:hypothetical protein